MEGSITMTDNFHNVCDFLLHVDGLKACMERPRWNKQDDNLKDWLYRSNNILALLLRLQSRSDNKKESKYVFLESLLRYINNTKNCNRFPDTVIATVIRKENETIKISFKEELIDWMETEVIHIIPQIDYSLAGPIYRYYECLIRMFNLDSKQDFKVVFDTELQNRRKMFEEKITVFEQRDKTLLDRIRRIANIR